MPRPEWVIQFSRWEDTDYVVSIRPKNTKSWEDVPIGPVLDRQQAMIVVAWLVSAIDDLMKLADNTRPDGQ